MINMKSRHFHSFINGRELWWKVIYSPRSAYQLIWLILCVFLMKMVKNVVIKRYFI